MRRMAYLIAVPVLSGAVACENKGKADTDAAHTPADSAVLYAACSAARVEPIRDAMNAGKEPKLTFDNVSRGPIRPLMSACHALDSSRFNTYEIQFIIPEAALGLWGDSLSGGLVRVYSPGGGPTYPSPSQPTTSADSGS